MKTRIIEKILKGFLGKYNHFYQIFMKYKGNKKLSVYVIASRPKKKSDPKK